VRNPTRFAAALPICGAGDPSKADLIKLLPLWTFHGDADPTVPVKGSRDMVAALKTAGSTVQYSEYPGVGHDAWTMTYANEAVIDWLFENKKASAGGAGGMGGAGGSGVMAGAAGSAGSGGAAGGSGGGSAGQAAGGNATAGSSSGGAAGGSAAGTATTGGVNVAGSGMTNAELPINGEDSGCSVSSPGMSPNTAGAFLLGSFALLLLQRRRASR
jgi:MYXO-CTERM domain-containing protein